MNDAISNTLVPEEQRLSTVAKLFGQHFLIIEPTIFAFADWLSRDYHGAYWQFFTLSNGGFYMAPSGKESFHVSCDNYYEGDLSAGAFGITSCLYAYSHLSFSDDEGLAELCTEHYHRLREYMMDQPEAQWILAAID